MNQSKKRSFRFRRRSSADTSRSANSVRQDGEGVILTKTLEKHRRRIIRGAKQYRLFFIKTNQYVVSFSLIVLAVALIAFSGFVYWRLYEVQDQSTFIYNITRVAPLPVARVGLTFVPYEDYLHDLRRQVHYFETHQQIDFNQPADDAQITLAEIKDSAMQRVIDNVYVKKLADKYNLVVSEQEIDKRLVLLQAQNKLGRNLDDIENVLKSFWAITLEEYRQLIEDKLLAEKVVRQRDIILGNRAQARAEEVLDKLQRGDDFAELAREYSENVVTAVNGGEYEFLLDLEEQEENPLVLQAIFETDVGQYSEIIDTGERLEIIQVITDEGNGRRRAAHISISYLPLSSVLKDIRQAEEVKIYIDDVSYNPNF